MHENYTDVCTRTFVLVYYNAESKEYVYVCVYVCTIFFFLINIRIAVTRRFIFLQIHATIIQCYNF